MNKEKAVIPRVIGKVERIGTVIALIAGFILIFIIVSNSGQAALRYLFRRPIPEVYDISLYLEMIIFTIPMGYILLQRGHISVDVLVLQLPLKLRQRLLLGTDILGAVVAVLLIIEGVRFTFVTLVSGTTEYTTGYPTFTFAMWLLLASIFLLICFLCMIYKDIGLIRQGKPEYHLL